LLVLAGTGLLMLPLAFPIAGKPQASGPTTSARQSLGAAFAEAFKLPSFWLLTIGFFVCGFHVAFYSVHLPAYVADQGMDPWVGVWALMAVGIANIVGTWAAGQSAKFAEKRLVLSLIYFGRVFVFLGLLFLPISPMMVIIVSTVLGFLWLSTVPLTSSLVATFFGTTWMSMLFGFVFLSHQVGSFAGLKLAGMLYDRTQSYDMMWWLSAGLGLFAALLHWPIRERPVPRLMAQTAPA
ncbi:MAG: MFS transporter, partial [Pseudomonadota bacterium]